MGPPLRPRAILSVKLRKLKRIQKKGNLDPNAKCKNGLGGLNCQARGLGWKAMKSEDVNHDAYLLDVEGRGKKPLRFPLSESEGSSQGASTSRTVIDAHFTVN